MRIYEGEEKPWTVARLIDSLMKLDPSLVVSTEGCDCEGYVGDIEERDGDVLLARPKSLYREATPEEEAEAKRRAEERRIAEIERRKNEYERSVRDAAMALAVADAADELASKGEL